MTIQDRVYIHFTTQDAHWEEVSQYPGVRRISGDDFEVDMSPKEFEAFAEKFNIRKGEHEI